MVQSCSRTDGAARWLAGAVRTSQKRVEMLEAKNSFEYHADTSVPSHKSDDNVETSDTNPELQVPRRKSVGAWKYNKVRVQQPRRHAVWTAQFLPTTDRGHAPCSVPALDVPVATAPADEYVTSAPTTEFVTPPAAILAATAAPVTELYDLLEPLVPVDDVPVATAPVDEHVTSTPAIEFVTPPDAILAATDALVTALSDLLEPPVPVEYTNYEGIAEELSKATEAGLSAVKDEYTENFDKPATGPLADYISWLDTGPAPDKEKYFISMTRSQEVRYAAWTIQWGWKLMRKKIELRAASEEKLQKKLREIRRRLVEKIPVEASAKKMEGLKEIQSTLKDLEKECRMLFDEDMKKLEIDSRCRSRMIAWRAVKSETIENLDD